MYDLIRGSRCAETSPSQLFGSNALLLMTRLSAKGREGEGERMCICGGIKLSKQRFLVNVFG
jgi:hypothetical protein